MNRQKLLVVVGQTASGKTSLGVELAKRFGGEIISADSRAVYKGMNIGTAKPSKEERQGITHHGFDLVDPHEHFHAYDFQVFAQKTIQEIAQRGAIPIVVGGTGLYVSGLINEFDFEGGSARSAYDVLQIGLRAESSILKERMNARVDAMVANGLVEEVRALKSQYGCGVKSMTGIGYRQICEYLDGAVPLEQAVERIKIETRQYAKRQMTWFKRDARIYWINTPQEAFPVVEAFLSQKA